VLLLYAWCLSPEKNIGLIIDALGRLQQMARRHGESRDFRLALA
jgi:enoyl-CoA hydratase/carnithine racemase